ncbi:MAG: hypothetical protein E7523_06075 [Ruminococcaceae bacterium]|nr:hypothetical protein [Oscillospiraceae bacterium]
MKFIIKAVSAIVSFFLMVFPCLQSLINDIEVEFNIDTAVEREEMENLMQSVNVWEMGTSFIGAENNETNDIFDFVRYVQLMQCSGGNAQRDLFKDPYDTSVLDDYDFSRLIDNCAGILQLGAKPHLKLGNVPMKYSKDYAIGNFEVNVYPPDDYNVYYNYIAALAQALVDRFGKEELRTWRFGVMTEYENADWFKTANENPDETAIEFCKLYDYTVQALIDVIGEDVCVGAHSMTVTEGLWDERIFIDHLVDGTNYANGKTGSKVNFLTASFYDSKPGQFTEGFSLPETVAHLKNYAESKGLTNLFYGIDEGRILVGDKAGRDTDQLLSRTTGYTWQAAYDARLWLQAVDSGLSYFSSWYYLSDGLLNGNPTVSYHVAKLFAGFEGMQRIDVDGGKEMKLPIGSEAKALAAVDAESGNIRIMAYSFRNDTTVTGTADMKFRINLPDGEYSVVRYYIDDNCNYFDEWLVDREKYNITDDCFAWSPEDPLLDNPTTLSAQWARDIYFNELKAGYAEKAELIPVEQTVTVTGGTLVLEESILLNTVVFMDILK